MTANDIDLDTPLEREEEVRDMLRKYEGMCSGQLGELNITKMSIDVAPDRKPFKSPLY